MYEMYFVSYLPPCNNRSQFLLSNRNPPDITDDKEKRKISSGGDQQQETTISLPTSPNNPSPKRLYIQEGPVKLSYVRIVLLKIFFKILYVTKFIDLIDVKAQ